MRRSRPKLSASPALLWLALTWLAGAAAAQELPLPLTDQPGDPVEGRAIVTSRERGLCILCHAGPFEEVDFMGDLAPDLAGVGARLSEAELRQRMVDSRVVNPDTIMPPYLATE